MHSFACALGIGEAAELGACTNVTCNAWQTRALGFQGDQGRNVGTTQRQRTRCDGQQSGHQVWALLEKLKDQCRANEGSAGLAMDSLAVGDWKMK